MSWHFNKALSMKRRSSFAIDFSLLWTIPLVRLLCIDSVQGKIDITVSYTGSNATFTNYSDRTFFSKRFDNIPGSGIEGHLFLPTPVNACSYIDPPLGDFPTNSTWIALVYDYPSCPTDMVMNVRNAGYRLIIASSRNDSHRTVSREVSDSLFPIAIVNEHYADYLKINATSDSTDEPIFVSVKGSISESIGVVAGVCTGIMFICYFCFICCMSGYLDDGNLSHTCLRQWKRCTCLRRRRRNFDHLPRHEQLLRPEQAQRYERLGRQELTESIRRHIQILQHNSGVQTPLGEEQTQRLPIRQYNSKNDTSDQCAICVDEFIEEDHVRVLPCNHIFHPQCINEWLANHSSLCPLCKKEVPRQGRSERRNVTDSTRDEDMVESVELLPQSRGRRSNQVAMYGAA